MEILAPLLVVLITLGLGLTILFSLAAWVTGEVEVREQLNFIVRAFAVILLAVVALAALFHATGCVGREREQKTLDMLLMLPDGRDGLLEMKWLGSFLCGRWLMAGLLAVLALGVIGGGIDPVALPLLAIVAGIHLALIASLGVFLSVLIPGTARAGVMGVVILVVACIIPLIVYPGAVGAIPPVAWVLCLPRSFDAIYLHRHTVAAMSLPVGVIVYAGAGVILWLFAQRRFESESG